MIRFALRCANAHEFESWFGSAAAFDRLKAAGELACPDCGTAEVDKAVMAPQVRAAPEPRPATPEAQRRALLARLRREVEAKSEYVGNEFPAEARRIHEGAAPERSIWGEARIEEAKALVEDGVPVAPLPFTPTRKMN